MSQQSNPYESPTELSGRESQIQPDQVVFDGVVTVEDIADLIRVPRIKIVMRVLAVIVIAPFIVLPLVILIVNRTEIRSAIGVLVVMLSTAVTIVALDRSSSRARRAKRLVAKHPDLVGVQRGVLNRVGITFFSGFFQEYHHLAWGAFPEVVVNRRGIRLDLRNQDYSFIAIPARMIERYDRKQVDALVQNLRSSATGSPIYESLPDWTKAPENAVRFQATIAPATQDKIVAPTYWICLITSSLVGCTILFYFGLDWAIALLVFTMVIAASAELYAISVRSLQSTFSIRHWGWLTDQGCQTHFPEATYAFGWDEAQNLESDEQGVLATFEDGGKFRLGSDDLLSGDWSTVLGWIEHWKIEHE